MGSWTLSAATLALLLVLAISGCATHRSGGATAELVASPRIPAAQGEVATETTKDGKTQVKVMVKHLAPPDKITQGATTYVVWTRPIGVPAAEGEGAVSIPERQESGNMTETGAYNLGGLKVSKDLDGELETVTPFKSFELFITAEPSPAITQPKGERILWAAINKE